MRIDIYDPAMCCSTGVCGPEEFSGSYPARAELMRLLSIEAEVV